VAAVKTEARRSVEAVIVVVGEAFAPWTDVVVVAAALGLVVEVSETAVSRAFFEETTDAPVRRIVVVVATCDVDTGEDSAVTAPRRPAEVVPAVAPEAHPTAAKLTTRIRPRRRRMRPGIRPRRSFLFPNTIGVLTFRLTPSPCLLQELAGLKFPCSSTLTTACCPGGTAITGAGEYTRPLNLRTPVLLTPRRLVAYDRSQRGKGTT